MAKIDALVINCDAIDDPGVQNRFLTIPITELNSFPKTANQVDPLTATNEGEVTLDESFAYANNAAFWRVSPIFQQSGEIKASKVGDVTNTGFKNEFTGMWADDAAAVRGFLTRLDNMAKCGGFVVLVPKKSGGFIVVGDAVSPAKLSTGNPSTGDKAGGNGRETKFAIESDGKIYYDYPSTLTAPRIAPVV